MIIENLKGHNLKQLKNSIEPLLKKIIQEVSKPIDLFGTQRQVSMSIGVTFYPLDGHCIEDILKNADSAMYQSKSSGRNTYNYYQLT